MPRGNSPQIPSYRLHKPTLLAVVRLNGHDVYLGKHGTQDSQDKYKRAIAEWLAGKRLVPNAAPTALNGRGQVTVSELVLAYWDFAARYYVKNGRCTGETDNIRYALRPLTTLYGRVCADEFGPNALKAVRQQMIDGRLCRTVVNGRVNRIRRMFKWGVENQMVAPSVLHALQAVAPLKRGRCEVREAEPVKPVPETWIDATLQHVNPQARAMIQLQRYTGMRPGEAAIIRGCDLETTGKIWTYHPASHKTQHHGRQRVIYFGPKAQEIVKPFLKPDLMAYLFSPREAMEQWHQQRRDERESPMTPSQASRQRRAHPSKVPGDHYTTSSYGHAIIKACDKAFPPPEGLTDEHVKQWRKDHHWHPNQLRHNAATFLRKQYGLDAARVILGHSSPAVTEIYAELDHAKAMQIMAEVG